MLLVVDLLDRSAAGAHPQGDLEIISRLKAICVASVFSSGATGQNVDNFFFLQAK